MPTYNYQCAACGPFRDSYPMSAYARPQPCPGCGGLAPRALTLPAIAGGAQETVSAAPMASHAGGCACCAAPRRLTAEAV